jgi:hypothetical protein
VKAEILEENLLLALVRLLGEEMSSLIDGSGLVLLVLFPTIFSGSL